MNQDIVNAKSQNPFVSMSYHIDFSDFLSLEEAIKSFCQLMGYFVGLESSRPTAEEKQHIDSASSFVDKLSERILCLLKENQVLEQSAKEELTNAFQLSETVLTKMLGKKKNFQHLRFMLMPTRDQKKEDIHLSPVQNTPLEVFDVLRNTSDKILLSRDTQLYKTKFVEKNSNDLSRLHYVHNFLNELHADDISDAKREFIVEWIFDNSLINALINEDLIYITITTLKECVRTYGMNVVFMHGILRALQKDFTILSKSAPHKLEQATSLIDTIFPIFVTMAKENLNYVSKNIMGFIFDMPVVKEDYRLIKWSQWRWIRMLATHTWDASLREPLSWVVSGGSLYCASIFECAPPVWLQDYAYLLIERVYAETLVESFVPTEQHLDYVEFLVRSLKKKSPYFASHSDSYLCLQIISRLTEREAHKEILPTPPSLRELNPVSQALGVLLRMTRV